jgi:hypothetical protein
VRGRAFTVAFTVAAAIVLVYAVTVPAVTLAGARPPWSAATVVAGAAGDTTSTGADVLRFGDAPGLGSLAGTSLRAPVVGMAATPTGKGYWLVASDGGIFSFGDASFRGSTGATTLNKPIVGMAATPTGNGYWLAGADGGIFPYGDATFNGSAVGATAKALGVWYMPSFGQDSSDPNHVAYPDGYALGFDDATARAFYNKGQRLVPSPGCVPTSFSTDAPIVAITPR